MIESVTIGERAWTFTVPETAADVLSYRVWVCAHAEDTERYVRMLLDWLGRFVVGFDVESISAEEVPDLVVLAEVICQKAGLPRDVLAGLELFWRRSSDLEDHKPAPGCDCPRCMQGVNVPDGVCKYDGISQESLLVGSVLMGMDDAGAMLDRPYWYVQVAQLRARLRNESSQKQDKEREDSQTTEDIYDRVSPGWRERRH